MITPSDITPAPIGGVPQLLVSVRDLAEARLAFESDVDLIDLKEPHHGSLGRVELSTARQIADALPDAALSLALGELNEWKQSGAVWQIPASFEFLKMGLAGEANNKRWPLEWESLRQNINEAARNSFQWIAVVYADDELANSPDPEQIIEVAIETGCAGVLFDTWSKQSGGLLDGFSVERLKEFRDVIHSAGLLTALAGSLRETHLPALKSLGADIIAVRGAVCEADDRTAKVSATRIKTFREALRFSVGQPG